MQNQSTRQFLEDNYLLLLIILLGAALRVFDLGGESVWLDEVVTSNVAGRNLDEFISWVINTNDNNPPLYYLIMHFWVSVFGHSEFSLRFPSVIFGTGSILMIYMVGRQILSRHASLIAALILAVSVFNIEYSQEARAYSLLAFLTLCSFYFYMKILSGSKSLFMVGYVVASVLLLYTHFYAVFVLVIQNVFCFTRYFQRRDVFSLTIFKWIILQFITGLLFIPGLFIWFADTSAIQKGFWLYTPTLYDLASYAYHFSGRNYTLCILLMILSALSLLSLRGSSHITNSSNIQNISKDKKLLDNLNTIYFLLLWLILPALLAFIISQISTPILHSRYIIGSSLAFFLLAAKGIVSLNNRKLTVLIPILILLLSIWPLAMYYKEAQKHNWRDAISYIEKNADQNDVIYIYPHFDMGTTKYYKKRYDLEYMRLNSETVGELPERFWVVFGEFSKMEEEPARRDLLGGYDLEPVASFSRLNLYLYEKD